MSSTQNEILKPNIPLLGDFFFLHWHNIPYKTSLVNETKALRPTYPQQRVCAIPLLSLLHPEMLNYLMQNSPMWEEAGGSSPVPAFLLRISPRSKAQRSPDPRVRREMKCPFSGFKFGLVSKKKT